MRQHAPNNGLKSDMFRVYLPTGELDNSSFSIMGKLSIVPAQNQIGNGLDLVMDI
jgi:hypothetical protein